MLENILESIVMEEHVIALRL